MNKAFEKILERLEETKDIAHDGSLAEIVSTRIWNKAIHRAKQVVQEVSEEYNNDQINLLAMMYAKNLVLYGVDITKIWDTATRQAAALNQAYIRGRQYGRDRFVKLQEEYNNGWIPCSKKMPPVEKEVWIVAKRKWKDGNCKYITTTAMYEDGTVLENDSCWWWEDIEGEWNEEEDCYIIPEGWWENKHYNADGELNHAVDDEVIAWQPLPEPYKESEG